jgi:predicted CXXCH cytochrome family protein
MASDKYIASSILLLTIVLFIISCSPQLRHNVLSTFFDGVPAREYDLSDSLRTKIDRDDGKKNGNWGPEDIIVRQVQQADGTWSSVLGPNQLTDSTAELAKIASSADFKSMHPPYKERDCNACHNAGNMGKLNQSQPALCFQCHETMAARKEYSHGPAASGHCTTCHSPHKSEKKNLLLSTSPDLCLNCHAPLTASQNRVHKEIDGKDCVQCHNPHSSEMKHLLQPGLCTSCHGDFGKDYNYLHGPVLGEYCSVCHQDHLSGTKSLLASSDQQLCLNCHNEAQVFESQKHKAIGKQICTECHNPHGGNDQFMLR